MFCKWKIKISILTGCYKQLIPVTCFENLSLKTLYKHQVPQCLAKQLDHLPRSSAKGKVLLKQVTFKNAPSLFVQVDHFNHALQAQGKRHNEPHQGLNIVSRNPGQPNSQYNSTVSTCAGPITKLKWKKNNPLA